MGVSQVTQDLTKIIKWSIIGIIGIVVLILIVASFTIIEPTQRGVRVTLGKADDVVLASGMYFNFPLVQSIKIVSLVPKKVNPSVKDIGNAAITKDNQSIMFSGTAYWIIDETKIVEYIKGYNEDRLTSMVEDNIKTAIKSTVGSYGIYDLAGSQTSISEKALELLNSKIVNLPVTITNLIIENWDWSREFDKQIEQTMQAAQEVKRQEQELKKIEITTQKQVKEAEAEKQAIELKAEANLIQVQKESEATLYKAQKEAEATLYKAQKEAEAKVAEGKGIADYNRLVAQNLSQEIKFRELEIQLERARRFNGQEVPYTNFVTQNGAIVPLGK